MSKEENLFLEDQEVLEDTNEQVNFEAKIEQAQQLLEKLIDPQITLSQSVKIYKQGIKELEVAQELLESAKLEFKEIS
jgi:exodeoxyribonuclease VII small subunit